MQDLDFLKKYYEKYGITKAAELLGLDIFELVDMLDLDFKTFVDLDFEEMKSDFMRGIKAIMMFPNGFGISVVKSDFSYGGSQGYYEIAVLGKDGDLNYDTEITNDVVGYLDEDGVSEYMIKIQGLKPVNDEKV